MRVRPLIDCIMSEIEPFFLFSDLGINIDSINHYLSVLPVFISEPVWSLYFYIRYYHVCTSDSVYSFYCQV